MTGLLFGVWSNWRLTAADFLYTSSQLSPSSLSHLCVYKWAPQVLMIYGSWLRTFSGSYLYPSLCGRHLEWEKRVCHSQTVTFSFLIQKQDSLVIWLTVRVMSFGLGLCRWSERTIYLWMCLFSFLSYFLFWFFLRGVMAVFPAVVGGPGVLSHRSSNI